MNPARVRLVLRSLVTLALAQASVACDGAPASETSVDAGGVTTASEPDGGSGAIHVFVEQADFPQGSNGCTFDHLPLGNSLTSGKLDLAFRQYYSTALLMGFTATGETGAFTRLLLSETEVRLEDESGAVVLQPASINTAGILEATVGGDMGYGVVQVMFVPPAFTAAITDELKQDRSVRHFTSVVRVSGRSLQGEPFISDEFRLPVDICYGCLVQYPADANDPAGAVQPNCAVPIEDFAAVPCILGQDEPLDCRLCNEVAPESGVCEPPTP